MYFDQTDTTFPDQLHEIFKNRTPKRLDADMIRHFAVLVPLVKKENEWHILFEVRSSKLKTQPGDICFPGGRLEDGEMPATAALRETCEELLIDQSQIRLLASLDYMIRPGNMNIYPFLGELIDYKNTFSLDETERIFTVPLSWFIEHDPQIHYIESNTHLPDDFPIELIPGGSDYRWRRGRQRVLFYDHPQGMIWGITAAILHGFIRLIS